MDLYFKTREEWREWLKKNHSTAENVWIRYYKKSSGKPRIPYDDAVEEALCFGWIDGKIKRVNDEYYLQYFTPRRHGSRWSKYNVERVEKLINEGRMEAPGLESFREAIERPDLIYENRKSGEPEIPEDLKIGLQRYQNAWENFMLFPPSSRRMYCEWLRSAKRPETRENRIKRIVDFALKNIKQSML
jgi:uncharacterized protein YdeI (YjbR/CyaY-like superfamily)